jgi:hypothetical protein
MSLLKELHKIDFNIHYNENKELLFDNINKYTS